MTQLAQHNSKSRRGDIQGLRAVAVLLVVIYHSGVGLPGGFVGVDVFFVISGYVITRMLTAELAGSGRLDLKRFYLRRIRRLLPALGLMLSVVMLASSLLASIGGQKVIARTGGAAALLNANSYLMRLNEGSYFALNANVNALIHTWSLSVEEQFYLVVPALLLAAWMLGQRIRIGGISAATAMLVLIIGISFPLSWVATYGHGGPLHVAASPEQFAFYSSPSRAWEFAVGGLLAIGSRRLIHLSAAFNSFLAVAGTTLILLAAITFDAQTAFPGVAALVPVIGTLFILGAGVSTAGNPVSRLLAVEPAQFVGDLSYSWYLWHWPFIVFAAALWPASSSSGWIAAALSLLPAWLSYRFLESPIRFAQNTTTPRTLLLASVCIMLPLVSAVALEGGNRVIRRTDAVHELEVALGDHADELMGCRSSVPLGARDQPECTINQVGATGSAVLIGDSNAGHFSEAFLGATRSLGIDATVATMSECPFVDLVAIIDNVRRNECRTFVAESVRYLVHSRPNIVVLASSSDGYIESSGVTLEDPDDGMQFSTPAEKAAAWTVGLTHTIGQLKAAGIAVIVVHPVPKFPGWDPRECATIRVLTDVASCATQSSATVIDQRRTRSLQAETAGALATSATTLDPAPFLCPDYPCRTIAGDTWLWKDGSHITVGASISLVPEFREALSATESW